MIIHRLQSALGRVLDGDDDDDDEDSKSTFLILHVHLSILNMVLTNAILCFSNWYCGNIIHSSR